MGKIVILEGPDGGGKTTLAKELGHYGFRYKHDGVPPVGRDNIAYYLEVLDEAINADQDTVFDRLWLGERIYGPVARGTDTIGEEGQRLFARLHNSKKIQILLCLPPLRAVQANYLEKIKDSSDYLQSKAKLNEVYQEYQKWGMRNRDLGLIYNYETASPDMVVKHMDTDWPTLPPGTVGSLEAKYLFIGDTPNHPSIDVPFHALNGSSGYLNNALTLAGIKEEDLALSNAFSPNNTIAHDPLLMVYRLPKLQHVFLMGTKALDWWCKCEPTAPGISNVNYYHIPHPSYLKRFKGSDPRVMADIIKEKLNGSPN